MEWDHRPSYGAPKASPTAHPSRQPTNRSRRGTLGDGVFGAGPVIEVPRRYQLDANSSHKQFSRRRSGELHVVGGERAAVLGAQLQLHRLALLPIHQFELRANATPL